MSILTLFPLEQIERFKAEHADCDVSKVSIPYAHLHVHWLYCIATLSSHTYIPTYNICSEMPNVFIAMHKQTVNGRERWWNHNSDVQLHPVSLVIMYALTATLVALWELMNVTWVCNSWLELCSSLGRAWVSPTLTGCMVLGAMVYCPYVGTSILASGVLGTTTVSLRFMHCSFRTHIIGAGWSMAIWCKLPLCANIAGIGCRIWVETNFKGLAEARTAGSNCSCVQP